MKALLQRTSRAEVAVDGEVLGSIGPGLLVLLGVGREDDASRIAPLVKKMLSLRIFDDDQGRMNLSVRDARGDILIVSQFTLYADARKGARPSYTDAAPPETALALYEQFIEETRRVFDGAVEEGRFGAEMQISLVNDGPVTILLES